MPWNRLCHSKVPAGVENPRRPSLPPALADGWHLAMVEAAFQRTTLAEVLAEPTDSHPLCEIAPRHEVRVIRECGLNCGHVRHPFHLPLPLHGLHSHLQPRDTLLRVYDSLRRQTRRDFEWLVIDDGSTDGTRELVEDWRAEADFPIRYEHQENRGKHMAFNRAAELAAGELFINLDSDDACTPDALEHFNQHWEAIPPAERDHYGAVTCLCQDQAGQIVGGNFPRDGMDADYLSLRYIHGVRGEKWSCHRTAVLREFPFPAARATHVPEGIIWSRIARRYRERCVNEPLRIYHVDGPSLVHGQAIATAAVAGRMQHLHALNEELDFFRYSPREFLRSAVHYARFSWHQGIGVRQQCRDLRGAIARLLWLAACWWGGWCFGVTERVGWDQLAQRAQAHHDARTNLEPLVGLRSPLATLSHPTARRSNPAWASAAR